MSIKLINKVDDYENQIYNYKWQLDDYEKRIEDVSSIAHSMDDDDRFEYFSFWDALYGRDYY